MSQIDTAIQTLVIKVGTTLLSGPTAFDGRILEQLVKEICSVKRARNLHVLMVSSGAIGCGMSVLNMTNRPRTLPLKQATAAVGQSRLMHYYETLFQTYGNGLHAAQVLVTASELNDRTTYLNVRNTLHALLALGNTVPIINENDSVATEELCFGDNDTLAARVAAGIGADLLILLSDIDGLYDKNPRRFPEAKHLPRVDSVDDTIMALAEDTTTETSIGGMRTKLHAARIATASGIPMAIADGRREGIIDAVLAGEGPMTWFAPSANGLSHRKRWIAFGRTIRGTLTLDEGACRAVREKGRSLLPAGIAAVSGQFEAGDAVQLTDPYGVPFAQGLTNYARPLLDQIIGHKTTEIAAIIGRKDFDEVIHRDNMVLL